MDVIDGICPRRPPCKPERKPGGAAASGWRASFGRRGGWTPGAGRGGWRFGLNTGGGTPFPSRTLVGQRRHPARLAEGESFVLPDAPAPTPSPPAPARIPRALLPGLARAFPTRVSTCPARKNAAPSCPRSPFPPSKHLLRRPNPDCSCSAAWGFPTPPSKEPRRRPRTRDRVRLPEPRGTRPSLQATPAEGAAGEAEAVPRGAPAAVGALPPGNSADRGGS